MSTYSQRDLKLLFARSGGLCAFRGCRQELVVRTTGDIIGHIAHVIARSGKGPRPRSDPLISQKVRDGYENLILLCPTHHSQIDAPSGSKVWTPEEILAMKKEHEVWVSDRLAVGKPVLSNVSQLDYLNVPRLSALASLSGMEMDISFLDGTSLLIDTGLLTGRLMDNFAGILAKIRLHATPLSMISVLDSSSIGVTALFDGWFWTKNVPEPQKIRTGRVKLRGLIEKDPHFYCKIGAARLMMAIDPKWILSITGWGSFVPYGGKGRFAGACTLKHIDSTAKVAVATPLFIGTPSSL